MSDLQKRLDIICDRKEDFHTRKRSFMVLLDEAERGNLEAAKLVPKAYANCGGELARAIREDLRALRNSKVLVEFCKEWLSSRNSHLRNFLERSGWEVSAEEDIEAFFYLNLLQQRREVLYQQLEANSKLCSLAVEAAEDKEEKIHQEARYILQEFKYKNQDLINLLAQRWVETRSDWIESLLLKHKYKPTASPKVRVLVLLKTSQRHELHKANEDIIREVLYACADRDKDVAREAEKLIAEQKESWGPIILRWFSAEDFPEAGKAIVKASYALPNPDDTALLYFLCGDINAYEERDPEYAYLQSTYGKASPELKARLRAKLQAIGRPDIASVVLYQKDAARLEQLSYEEWETLIHALKAAKNLSELWQLVFKAPPHWAAEIVLFLHEEFFVPPSEEEKKVFKRLVRLCPEEGKRALFLDPNKRELELVAQCGPFESINQVRFSQDGQYVAYSTHDRKISVRHVSLGNEVFRHKVESSKWGWKLLQSPSAKKLLVGVGKLHNNRTTIEIWDISLPSVVFSYETTNSISSYWLMKDHSVIIAENHQGGTYIYRKSLHSNDQPSSFP
ncbi:MAG: hypothetical protein RMJ66_08085, partial [Bacteroidia bacterium]|nr:hypothetical protein [Bacteroidia bacterium]